MAETVFNSHDENLSEKESQYLPLIRLISYGHDEVPIDLKDIVQTGFIFDFLHNFDPIHFEKVIWSQVRGIRSVWQNLVNKIGSYFIKAGFQIDVFSLRAPPGGGIILKAILSLDFKQLIQFKILFRLMILCG